MGKLTTEVFDPSCCEGGVCETNSMSAQSCGCDPGANWTCSYHREQYVLSPPRTLLESSKKEYLKQMKMKKPGKLKAHLNDVVLKTWNFAGRLRTPQDHQMNALVGLASEAGETLDIGKKMWFHTEKDFNSVYRPALVKELGDVIYYLLITLHVFGITMKEVLEVNREKLESRHPELQKVSERFPEGFIR